MKKSRILFVFTAVLCLLISCKKESEEIPNFKQLITADLFKVTPKVLEAVGGKVPAIINGVFPAQSIPKSATVKVTPALIWNDGRNDNIPFSFQGEDVDGVDQVVRFTEKTDYTLKTVFDYAPKMAKCELYLEFDILYENTHYTFSVKCADGVISTSE